MGVDRLVRKSLSPDRLLGRLQNSTNAMVDIIDLTRESLFRTNTDSQDSTIKIRPETINVRSIIDESLDIFDQQIKAKNIAINKVAVENNRIIVSDRRILIYQIFNNILSNAIKFSYERGSIDISTSSSESHLTVVFMTGCGIKKEDSVVTSRKVAFHQMARAVKRELVSVLKTCTISQIYSALRSQSRVDTTLITKLIVEAQTSP